MTANNLGTASAPPTSVAQGAAIPLGSNLTLNGTAITHTAGSPNIGLAPNQTYSIQYNANGISSTGGFSASLALDGANIQSSQGNTNGTGGTQVSVSGGAIISTGAAASTLTLINSGIGNTTYAATSVNVIKLA